MPIRSSGSLMGVRRLLGTNTLRTMSSGGSGDGGAGSIRDGGGAFAKREAAQEEVYFNQQNQAMKKKLKEHLASEIKKHEEAIKKNSQILEELESDGSKK
ncbi:ATPase inhibitor, mitochondrial [Fragariocoptes setiger]|uniref:ATPase inhibitor, mitochondrial n=1 Tax=Fragariocoptes setiger TaxID=1670756 RepID=A0ABQ7S5D1_9ACAR|nr:ATPase inhibitor, mitochondrial [Fragariocoptes setiger]